RRRAFACQSSPTTSDASLPLPDRRRNGRDKEETMAKARVRITRRQILQVGAGSLFVPFSLKAGKAPAQGGKKPFEGVTLNIACWSATYPKLIADYLPEFTEKTGIKVNYDTPGFPVYNQRADLELSTKGSGFDVLNVTFIYTSRWIGAGWLTPLDPFINDPN